MAEMRIYNVDALGKPLGQYSHVTRVAAREFLFVAGMLAPGDSFDEQCSGVFAQISEALKSAGAGWQNIVQFTTYLVHSQDIPEVHAVAAARVSADVPDGRYPPNTLPTVRPASPRAVPGRSPNGRGALATSAVRRTLLRASCAMLQRDDHQQDYRR